MNLKNYMKTKILKKQTISGTSGTHDLFIKIICSYSKSRETIPLKQTSTFLTVTRGLVLNNMKYFLFFWMYIIVNFLAFTRVSRKYWKTWKQSVEVVAISKWNNICIIEHYWNMYIWIFCITVPKKLVGRCWIWWRFL